MSQRSRINGKTARMRKLPSQKDFDKWWANKAANAGDDRPYFEKNREDYENSVMLDQANNYPDSFMQDYTDFQNAGGIKRLENAAKHRLKAQYYSELASPGGKYNGKQRRTLRKLSNANTKTSQKIDDAFNKKFVSGAGISPASYTATNNDRGWWEDYDPRDIMSHNADYSARQNVKHKDPNWSYNNDVGPDYRMKNPYNTEEGEWMRYPPNPHFIRHDDSDNPVDDDESDFNQEEPEEYDDDEGEE